MNTPPLSLLSGITRLCQGLTVVLVAAHFPIHLFPSALNYLALIPASYMPRSGFHGVISGFLVGIKQIIPDQELPFLSIKTKTLEVFATIVSGTYISWIYLRSWQTKPETKLRGDPSEDFAFSTFFTIMYVGLCQRLKIIL